MIEYRLIQKEDLSFHHKQWHGFRIYAQHERPS